MRLDSFCLREVAAWDPAHYRGEEAALLQCKGLRFEAPELGL